MHAGTHCLQVLSTSTIGGMVQLAIRCHPCAPVCVDELEPWLERKVDELRAAAPQATVRLSRLTQEGPSVDLEIGWLVELELADSEPLLAGHRLADALRDMRLLGLQPTLLTTDRACAEDDAGAGPGKNLCAWDAKLA
jgi:hypothetical protein